MKRSLVLLAFAAACGGSTLASQSAATNGSDAGAANDAGSSPVAVALSLQPSSTSVFSGGTAQLDATVTGSTDTAVLWSVDETAGGSVSASGLYTAPSVTSAQNFHVRATAHGDPTVTASATVAVTPPPAVPHIASFTASPTSLQAGQSATLSFAVTGATSVSIDQGIGAVTGNVTVTPAATTTYTLSATNSAGTSTLQATVTVLPAAQGAPVITSFSADATSLAAGQSAKLSFGVTGATSVSISPAVGTVTGTTATVTPSATTTYTLTATNPNGSAIATLLVSVVAPSVTLTLDAVSAAGKPISPFVYGYNDIGTLPSGTAFIRAGGNRYTAYNWETNASNAGSDFLYENDTFFGTGTTPGNGIWPTMDKGVPALVTLPMQGWVSKDTSGPVAGPPFPTQSARFIPTVPAKGAPFVNPPNLSDGVVYQDEFVHLMQSRYPGRQLFVSLDNEPDLWVDTHAEIQSSAITYAGLLSLTKALSTAVKSVAPGALVFGPVSYGFSGYVNLQGASDANANNTGGKWFLDYYLSQMKAASTAAGVRLLDVLDLHWYPEALSSTGVRVTTQNNTAAVQAARVEAPRSYWDASYVENSFIGQFFSADAVKGVEIVTRVNAKIAANYAGTKLAFSEYNPGGSDDISGAVAEADTLGIFGREGIYAATYWPLLNDNRFVLGAYRSFRNFDGAGSAFGDSSFSGVASDNAKASVYASYDAANPSRVVVVAINKTTSPLVTDIRLNHGTAFSKAKAYQLTAASAVSGASVVPGAIADVPVSNDVLQATLPSYSVTTYVFVP